MKRMIRPTTMFIHHFLSELLAFASSQPARLHAIPRPTIASTPRMSTIFTKYRMMLANMLWKLPRPGWTVHSYFLFCTGISLQHALFAESCRTHAPSTHQQSAPGMISEV